MKQTIDVSIGLDKIDKTAFYVSPKTGKKFLSMTILIREQPDQYQNDGFVVQKLPRDRKASGEKGPILGNAKIMDWDNYKKPSDHEQAKANGYQPQNDDDSEIPF